MGLDIVCINSSQKVGSYSRVQTIRYELLCGLKFYIEMILPTETKLIDYMVSLVEKKNSVQYKQYSLEMERRLGKYSLDGFSAFVYHSDSDGYLTSYEAKQFLNTWKKTNSYMEDTIRCKDGRFYLQDVFEESIFSGENISFC